MSTSLARALLSDVACGMMVPAFVAVPSTHSNTGVRASKLILQVICRLHLQEPRESSAQICERQCLTIIPRRSREYEHAMGIVQPGARQQSNKHIHNAQFLLIIQCLDQASYAEPQATDMFPNHSIWPQQIVVIVLLLEQAILCCSHA